MGDAKKRQSGDEAGSAEGTETVKLLHQMLGVCRPLKT